jgi:BCD family chlorophyll transporter-like MFS transporter
MATALPWPVGKIRLPYAKPCRCLTASKQTGFFFVFLLVMTTSLFLQQPVLEPYAREVFGLSIGESAGLNQFWGYGILVGIAIAGFCDCASGG